MKWPFNASEEGLHGRVDSVIGNNAEIKGDIIASGIIRIDGKVHGNVSSGGTVIIGKDGSVNGDVKAQEVRVSGQVSGDVVAEARVEIMANGQLKGNIKAPAIVVTEGAVFEGHCEMGSTPRSVKKGSIL